MASKDLEYLFHHVFLPPKVPHFDDTKDGAGDRALVDRLAHLTISFRDLCPIQYYQQWSTLGRAIRTFKLLHTGKTLSTDSLKRALADVRDGGIMIVHISMQNSGLIIWRTRQDYIIETFESSPSAAEVLASQKDLLWDFPSRSVRLVPSHLTDMLTRVFMLGRCPYLHIRGSFLSVEFRRIP